MKKIDKKQVPLLLRWITPDYFAESVVDIDFSQLAKDGVNVVVFDIDSTITTYNSVSIDKDVFHAIKDAEQKGSIKQVAIATNRRRLDFLEIVAELGEDIVYVYAMSFLNSKPFKLYYKRLFKKLHAKSEQCVMVGDKLFTDMLGAKRFGMATVHVDRLGSDSMLDKITPFRYIERAIAKHYRK